MRPLNALRNVVVLPLILLMPVALAVDNGSADRPVLSDLGRKKAMENMDLLNTNLRSLQDGLITIQKNERVINDEIRELEQLERDHVELKKKYDAYLAMAHREMVRNDGELRRVDDLDRRGSSDKGALAQERKQREAWRQDAQPKVNRVETLMRDLLKNVQDIQARRAPLKSQLLSWRDREHEYERAIRDHSTRRAELERMLGR